MVRSRAAILALALGAGGCASFGSAGEPAAAIAYPSIAAAYLPLEGSAYVVLDGHGAAIVVAPGVAATNAHNANLVAADTVIGQSADYDLLFFRSSAISVPATGEPQTGEEVIAYGQGGDDDLRVAHGVVRYTDAEVVARCPACAVQHAFAFEADAGKGFSGGPVVDAHDGRLLGVVFGFRDDAPGIKGRLMYAYDMKRVAAELARAQGSQGPSK